MMKWFWGDYLNDASEGARPHASPPRDEGDFYAEKLRIAGVTTRSIRYDGVNHRFMFWVGIVDKAGAAMDEACEWLHGIFADPLQP